MANVNKVHLLGRITQDIEVRYTPKGTAVADLNLAINRVRITEGGDKQEETTFTEVTLWGRQAELAGQYLGKGREVYIEGRLSMDTWEDRQTGQKRSKLKVIGENMQFIGGGQGGQGDQQGRSQQRPERPAQQPAPEKSEAAQAFDSDDEIPF